MEIPKDMPAEKLSEIERVSARAAALQLSNLVAEGKHTFPEAVGELWLPTIRPWTRG